ncbi:MAG: LysR family transcriptional regulator [Bdellovibrionota bacterium]
MNLNQLQYFYVVAKEQGFTNASKALRIQQPAISRMVRQLEESFGFDLFEKVGRNVRLTARGSEVFEHCKKIFGEVDSLKASLGQITGECRGPLVFAAADTIASHFVPAVLADYLAVHPKVYPSLFSGPASSAIDQIGKGDVEFGLFFHIPELPSNLEWHVFRTMPFRLVVRKSDRRNGAVIDSFIGSREIDDVSTRRFPTIERMRRDRPGVKITISSNNLASHKEMVSRGLGVSILPEFLVADDLKRGTLVDVYPKEKFEFAMKVVKRRNSVPSLNAAKFLDFSR